MKKLSVCLLTAVLSCWCATAFGWGKIGHDAIAYIAECNLTPKAKKNIEKYLGGRLLCVVDGSGPPHAGLQAHQHVAHQQGRCRGETTCPIPKATR